MAINDQLKKLYHTITGKTAEGMAIDEIIAELNADYPAGGGGSGGGGDDIFIVPLAIDGDDFKFDDVSPEDVLQAYKSDKLVVAKINPDTVEGEEAQITGFLSVAVKKLPDSDQFLTATLYLFYFQIIDVGTGMPGSLWICYANDTFFGSEVTYSAFVPPPGADGNVPTANNGEWVSAPPPKDVLIVNATPTSASTATLDVDVADIYESYSGGTPVFIRIAAMNINAYITGWHHMTDTDKFVAIVTGSNESITILELDQTGTNTVDYSTRQLPFPHDDNTDDGKVLGVEDGEYALVEKQYVVTITADDSGGEVVYSASHNGSPVSIADIYAAKQAGNIIVATAPLEDASIIGTCRICEEGVVVFDATFYPKEGLPFEYGLWGQSESGDDTWFVLDKSPVIYTQTVNDSDLPDIYKYWQEGRDVFIYYANGKLELTAAEYDSNTQKYKAQFTINGFIGDKVGVHGYLFETGETPKLVNAPITPIPDFTSSEAGYILKVNANGDGLEWVAP